ncbi:Lrp/AsnC family transcriptional regulator [Microbacterium marinilacus]|uniref:Lrp/AsnC family transcriptional regulator n=1 Tax=Microbacterium marinilacus TaxID=415209 RepID=A0ABP7B6L2_9MICO|nr:Lrp/AsnC family transcriptional regulator [Microbacterium marinilacus]MBY0689987.1 Lrp/AsnC family transcriptional regulator [Microbacterium marinilacus]
MDDLDERIVHLLEADGRLSFAQLGAATHTARTTAAEHVRRLIAERRLEVRGAAHPAVLGLGAMAYLRLAVDGPAAPVADAVAAEDDATFVSLVTGDAPVVLELRARDDAAIASAVARIREVPGVRRADVTRYLTVVRDVLGPVGPFDGAVDARDRRIIAELEQDGRLPFAAIARRVGGSPTAVRHRVVRLLASRALRIGAVVRHRSATGTPALGIGIVLDGAGADVVARLQTHDSVIFAAESLGAFDVIVTVRAEGAARLLAVVEQLRGWSGVRTAEAWVHLDVKKETYARVTL